MYALVIGARLSEPHTDELYADSFYITIIIIIIIIVIVIIIIVIVIIIIIV